jgi:hypothetical protein
LEQTLPGKREIESVQEKAPALRNRRWRNIKDFLKNYHDSRLVVTLLAAQMKLFHLKKAIDKMQFYPF